MKVFLNYTGLFGIFTWWDYFSMGAWSIGNELVFYLFFPFFVFFTKKSKPMMFLLSSLILIAFVYFAFFRLTPDQELPLQWRDYVNPLNQVFLFLMGFLVGHFLRNVAFSKGLTILLFLGSVGGFIFYPTYGGELIDIVTNSNRIVFSLLSVSICVSFYKSTIQLPHFLHKPLSFLGEVSYSIYLIHPIVNKVLVGAISILIGKNVVPFQLEIIISIIITLIVSHFVYKYVEQYFMALAKRKSIQPVKVTFGSIHKKQKP